MASQQASPVVKFEASPAESFLSLPGDNYTSLFSETSTINPLDMLSPESFSEDGKTPQLPVISEENETPAPEDTPQSEKKQTKKRKSWGQVLPEPKTNLPPR
jgi:transcriptional activator HAC1